ncbi:DUF1272 domain-containing protein [Pseudomonas sp. 10B1]|uniref:DUF1272 domain-containing protein n=1 Tax=unclassified Pseudomonas TaxID=196821 RepID=UPI002AB3A95E|nr:MULTISPECIES: DUF1272 domain-containing protein [unclassified Pseudomonas]MDY7558958.1 DUF1272 domain-containing protein [Pseudomonas sp. AB6]MEA9979463.1 DUF1272 domain-containing protein [Pseudomonas sp. RTS4]MEA9997158.1 DUF1272 domain-containing protein [Pseudomonas sp. AA4]MEB0089410.1 DUF1272 domain-containing protein [Pseudomonas sp. RTI1]MEB0124685.1 DUF1272 domain-containing protein [Pseudomonas sp. CCC1.2]
MLELRPSCEHCNIALPADSIHAMICSYECTFCADCVDKVLGNVCPNCGGGFAPRPVRPSHVDVGGSTLAQNPMSAVVRHRPVDSPRQAQLIATIGAIAAEHR